MEKLTEIKTLLMNPLKEEGFEMDDIQWLSQEKTLQVIIDYAKGEMDLEACTKASEIISELLDQYDPIQQDYNLEVCSPGAEREIKDLKQIVEKTYVHVDFKEAVKQYQSLEGYLSPSEDGYLLEYRDKANLRKLVLDENNIAFIRHAVKV